jgi:flagellar biogenesis protein FliO
LSPSRLSIGDTVRQPMPPLATYLVETAITLLGIAGLAVLLVVFGRRLGLGRTSGSLELVGKLALDPRRAVYLIRVNDLVYVLAASEAGIVQLGTFDAVQLPERTIPTSGAGGFRAVLERMRSGGQTRSSNDGPAREQP